MPHQTATQTWRTQWQFLECNWQGGCLGPLLSFLSTHGTPPFPATMPSCCSSLDCDPDTDDCDLKKNPKQEKVIHEIEIEVPEGEAREPKGPVSKITRPLFNPKPVKVPKVSQTLPAGQTAAGASAEQGVRAAHKGQQPAGPCRAAHSRSSSSSRWSLCCAGWQGGMQQPCQELPILLQPPL